MAVTASTLCYSFSHLQTLNPTRRPIGSTKLVTVNPNPATTAATATTGQPSFIIRATNSKPDEYTSVTDNSFLEDLKYVGKLGAGSFVGAGVIKYGSIVLPEITKPNTLVALLMVFTPVLLAIWLLIKQSQSTQQG